MINCTTSATSSSSVWTMTASGAAIKGAVSRELILLIAIGHPLKLNRRGGGIGVTSLQRTTLARVDAEASR